MDFGSLVKYFAQFCFGRFGFSIKLWFTLFVNCRNRDLEISYLQDIRFKIAGNIVVLLRVFLDLADIRTLFNLAFLLGDFMQTLKHIALVIVVTVSAGLSGCSSSPLSSIGSSVGSLGGWFGGNDKEFLDAENVEPAEQLYKKADTALGAGQYDDAAKTFEDVDRLHPYSPLARRSIVMAAFANYKAGKYPEAISGGQRYVTLHPGTKESALAQHVIAMSYYDQIADPKRDQERTKKALDSLETLVRRYPDSRYTPEAKNRIRVAKDVLAAADMNVGRYYLNKKNYLAAINRFKSVVKNYQTTQHVEEALARLAEAYMALGIASEAQTAGAILGHNFPNSPWYKDTYVLLNSGGLAPRENSGSWLSKTWNNTVTAAKKLNPL